MLDYNLDCSTYLFRLRDTKPRRLVTISVDIIIELINSTITRQTDVLRQAKKIKLITWWQRWDKASLSASITRATIDGELQDQQVNK